MNVVDHVSTQVNWAERWPACIMMTPRLHTRTRSCAANAAPGSLHMSFGCGRTGIEVPGDPVLREVGAPFEVPTPKSLKKGRYVGAA